MHLHDFQNRAQKLHFYKKNLCRKGWSRKWPLSKNITLLLLIIGVLWLTCTSSMLLFLYHLYNESSAFVFLSYILFFFFFLGRMFFNISNIYNSEFLGDSVKCTYSFTLLDNFCFLDTRTAIFAKFYCKEQHRHKEIYNASVL